jgi:hypothetical protein
LVLGALAVVIAAVGVVSLLRSDSAAPPLDVQSAGVRSYTVLADGKTLRLTVILNGACSGAPSASPQESRDSVELIVTQGGCRDGLHADGTGAQVEVTLSAPLGDRAVVADGVLVSERER